MPWNSYFDAPLLQQLLSAQGIPPVDQPAVVGKLTQTVASNTAPTDTPVWDVTRYQQVTVLTQDNGATANTNWRKVTHNWYQDTAGTILMSQGSYYYGAYSGTAEQKVAVPPGAAGLKISNTAAVTTTPASIVTTVWGSMRAATRNSSFNVDLNDVIWAGTDAESLGNAGIFEYSLAGAQAAGTTNMYPGTFDGPAFLSIQHSSVAGAFWIVNLVDNVTGRSLWNTVFLTSTSGARDQGSLLLPRRPIKIVSVIGGGTTTAPTISLTMQLN